MYELYVCALFAVGLLVCISSIDDLIIDLLVFFNKMRGHSTGHAQSACNASAEPNPLIAVFVANWHEADVLGQMVEKNIANITYWPFIFVLGVYPNDVETLQVASGLAEKYPELVRVVVNRRNGPTSKGQMLNEMFSRLYAEPATAPEFVVLHDSEDIIDPRSFAVYASRTADCALIQIPVFSLDSRQRSQVGATYMEEFAERHSREMVVRCAMGAFVPSAGVGTCIRKDLILHFLSKRGYVLQPGSVTEDYILGAEAHRAGYSSTFASVRSPSPQGPRTVATFEYFPRDFAAAIKQKSRWVYGIVFDGTRRLGWFGNWWDRFFLYRDRKGAITNLLPAVSLLLLAIDVVFNDHGAVLPCAIASALAGVLVFNMIAIAFRLYFRVAAFHEIYGTYGLGGLLLRWPLAIIINALAALRAWRSFLIESRFASRPIAWAKTQHELPAVFEPLFAPATRPVPARATSVIRVISSSLSIVAVIFLGAFAESAVLFDSSINGILNSSREPEASDARHTAGDSAPKEAARGQIAARLPNSKGPAAAAVTKTSRDRIIVVSTRRQRREVSREHRKHPRWSANWGTHR